ncbi:MAG: indolepyruvate oxidoreductase subunit beta [Syntrophales bacterium]|nr:indolepyruvate oxidoreductase subunit beta [Syntrophales bacterium]
MKKQATKGQSNGVKSVLFAGVGGQGILRASDIFAMALMESGRDVKKSEVHGMAQRGGCVTSHVRYGEKVYSPLEKKGNVDILLAFERLEALRYVDYLKPSARVIINDLALNPPTVNLGNMAYPQDIVAIMVATFPHVKVVNAQDIARAAGNLRAENTALLGVLSQWLDIALPVWERVIVASFPEKTVEANLKAFHLGRQA